MQDRDMGTIYIISLCGTQQCLAMPLYLLVGLYILYELKSFSLDCNPNYGYRHFVLKTMEKKQVK